MGDGVDSNADDGDDVDHDVDEVGGNVGVAGVHDNDVGDMIESDVEDGVDDCW